MKAYILLANGFEDIEAIVPADILKRAGIDVKLISIHDHVAVTSAHQIKLTADDLLKNNLNQLPDIIITPGGEMGAYALRDNPDVQLLLKTQHQNNRYIASICASPVALDRAGILKDKAFTCYPGFENQITSGHHQKDRIVVDDKLITAKGPGVAFDFSFKIVELTIGSAMSQQLKSEMFI